MEVDTDVFLQIIFILGILWGIVFWQALGSLDESLNKMRERQRRDALIDRLYSSSTEVKVSKSKQCGRFLRKRRDKDAS